MAFDAFDEVVVAFAAHVEVFVFDVVIGFEFVVITERGVKLHAGPEQLFVRVFKLALEVFRFAAAINVVAQHENEIKRRFLTVIDYLFGDGVLRSTAVPAVADDGEVERFGIVLTCRGCAIRQNDQSY